MKYKICKFKFLTGLHIGNGMLVDGEPVFMADTLFSALCQEALNIPNGIDQLVKYCRQGKLKISDGLPYIGTTCYVPKPMMTIESKEEGNSKIKKAFKKLKYIPIDKIEEYIKGDLDAPSEKEKLGALGKYEMRQKASISYEEETMPYYIGSFHFLENNGIYVIVGYEDDEILDCIQLLLRGLSFSGIGGKRSAGYGKFEVEFCDVPQNLKERLQEVKYQSYISLGFSLPKQDELEQVMDNSQFQLIKRSGFINSNTYATTYQKKRDFYGFAAGSCFDKTFEGDVFDVSIFGNHPVYRYAIPIFMGVI